MPMGFLRLFISTASMHGDYELVEVFLRIGEGLWLCFFVFFLKKKHVMICDRTPA